MRFLHLSALAACFASVPAVAQEPGQRPWWLGDRPETVAGPALAPIEDVRTNAPFADGTELSRLSDSVTATGDVQLSGADVGEEGGAATLLADQITLSGDRTLTASGGVVVWYQGTRLVADAVRYDGETGDMAVSGPIHLTRPGLAGTDSEAVLIADQAELTQDMREGLLRGARLVLAREMQLAATEVALTGEGRYTTLRHVVASSCQVCASDPVPLWEIRARQITHDTQEHKLLFEHPQLRAFGLPVAAWPGTLTAPDPSVERMSGFLRPSIRTTSGLGFGVMLPWFRTLGPHADVTLTPYLAASETQTLMTRYRHAFRTGEMEWNGAVSRDDIRPGRTRGYLFGAARWELPRQYNLGLQVQMTSDRAYLLDYGISDADRLWSGLTLDRITADKLVWARAGNYHSLRVDENNTTSPAQVADVMWQKRWSLAGGEAGLDWSLHGHRRPSSQDQIGRDMARATLAANWRGSRIVAGGIVASAGAGVDADFYAIRDDSRYAHRVVRALPWLSVGLRYPLTGSDGRASYLLEPVAQIVWSPGQSDTDVPNEDSRQVEFDEGNLFALSRYPGFDRRETGLRANLGVQWTRFDPAGWQMSVAGGRIVRSGGDENAGASTAIQGKRSDWLLAAHYADNSGLSIANRALIDDDLSISRDELRIGWARPGLQLSLGYLWLQADEAEDRPKNTAELTGEIGWQLARGWWATANTRHDFQAGRTQTAGFGVTYRNECITVELGAKRRFTSTDEVRPDTDVDLSVRLGGFGRQTASPGTVARRACMR